MGPSVQSGSNRVRIHLMTAGCSQVTIRPLVQRPLVCWSADDAWPRSGDSPESLSSTSVGMQDLAGPLTRRLGRRMSKRRSGIARRAACGKPTPLRAFRRAGAKNRRGLLVLLAPIAKSRCVPRLPCNRLFQTGNWRDARANSGHLEPATAHHSSCVPRVVFHDEGH
jgi:hypothetical protein